MDQYVVEYFNAKVVEAIEAWPADVTAAYGRVLELIGVYGPNLRMPYSRAMGDGLFELRARGASGNARALYCFRIGRRVVVLHAFRKKSRQTADHDLALARRRLKELSRG
jgi:phage-related protein